MMNFITYDSEDYANEYDFNLKIMYAQLIYISSKHISYWLIIDKMLLSKFDPNICVTPYLRDFTAHRLYRILNIQKIEKH